MSAVKCRPMTDDEVGKVANALENLRDRALFLLGCCTGFRIAELCQVRVRDVWQYGKPTPTLTVAKSKMKGSKRSRTVVLHDIAKQAIVDLVISKGLAYNDELFKSREGGSVSEAQMRLILRRTFEALQLPGPLSTHSMRKTFARKVYEASGRDLRVTQLALGHKSIDSTTKYLEIGEEQSQAVVLNLKF